jgi:ABC-type branched-subunit amino acid transport system ATPase component/ABC-type branched-subunit amino acid transport system permease subunit
MSRRRASLVAHAGAELARAIRAARAGLGLGAVVYVTVFVAALVVLPAVASPATVLDLASGVYLMLAAVGLNFALGLGDVPSLGQGAFAAVGAFSVALLRTRAGWGLEVAVFAAVGLAAVAGALAGAGAARLRPVYVAISTWIVAWLVAFGLESFPALSGGAQGLILGPGRLDLGALGASVPLTPTIYYAIGLVLLAGALLAFARVARGPAGLALAALRQGETMARAVGARPTRLRIGVFVTSAALAGLGGAGIAQTLQVADPGAYGPLLSVELFVAVLLGGAGTVLGPVVGVGALASIAPLSRALGDLLSVPADRFEPAISAALLLAALAIGRGGIVRVAHGALGRPRAREPAPAARPTASALTARDRAGIDLEARAVTKVYGGVHALDRVDMTVKNGSIHALIGPNGSGKTTLLRILAGAARADAGEILVDGTRVPPHAGTRTRLEFGVARTLQRTEVWPELTVMQHVVAGAGVTRRYGGPWRDLFATPKARAEAAVVDARAAEILAATRLTPHAGDLAASLSSGDQRLLMIAVALAAQPRLLLLDEPSAGMSRAHADVLAEVLRALSSTGLTIVVVEHNLRLVRYLADRVTVLDAGRVIAEGGADEVAASSSVRAAYLGRATL